LKAFSFFNKSITAIDPGSYETKIIEGKQERDGIAVKKAFSFMTPPDTYDNGYIKDEFRLAAAAREELRKNNISGGTCHITVKSTAILTREILLPSLSSKDIEGLLSYQLEEYLPMDFSKYVIQHKGIEKVEADGKEKLNVLVVAIPRELVDLHYNFVRELGMNPEVMDYQSNGIWKFLNYAGSINGSLYPREKILAAIDMGYSSSNVTIISKGNAKISRVIDSGGLSVKTNIEGIMDKIDKVFKYYASKEPEERIEVLLLYGGLSRIKGIEKLFSGYFNIPASVLDNTGKIHLAGDINTYANCIGALIRDDGV
jgi:type IV pilus assembly protein PilM